VISNVTEITEFYTKSDMSRWTRAHADAPGITWSVFPGPGGTMIVVEHEKDRSSLTPAPAPVAATPVSALEVAPSREVAAYSASSLQARRSSWASALV
jgi:hypothetical protein